MSWTKRQIIEQAFDEIGLASYVFDLTADQLESALRRLDSMIAMWDSKGIRLGYPLPSSPQNSDLDAQTNMPDKAVEAAFLQLAIRLAPSYGKNVSPDTKAAAKQAYEALLITFCLPAEMQIPAGYPKGAGYKPYAIDDPFTSREQPITVGSDSVLDF
jgi:hypothetical protein